MKHFLYKNNRHCEIWIGSTYRGSFHELKAVYVVVDGYFSHFYSHVKTLLNISLIPRQIASGNTSIKLKSPKGNMQH